MKKDNRASTGRQSRPDPAEDKPGRLSRFFAALFCSRHSFHSLFADFGVTGTSPGADRNPALQPLQQRKNRVAGRTDGGEPALFRKPWLRWPEPDCLRFILCRTMKPLFNDQA